MRRMTEDSLNTQVLMIDDDLKLCRLVGEYLMPFGFEVSSVHTGPEGVEAVKAGKFDAVILDVMLPRMDGFEVLRQIRSASHVPVLMLTALGDEADRIVGLEIGADDYLPKTFSTRELLARLRAATRRGQLSAKAGLNESESITAADVSVDATTRVAIHAGKQLSLTVLEFDLLLCLVRSAGRVLNRDQILDEIAGRDYDVFDRSIDVHISSLRRKLGDDFKDPQYIRTIRSVGYMFVARGGDEA